MAVNQVKNLGVLTSGGRRAGHERSRAGRGTHSFELRLGSVCHLRRLPGYGRWRRPHSEDELGFRWGILHQGGTIIGSARCADFRTRKAPGGGPYLSRATMSPNRGSAEVTNQYKNRVNANAFRLSHAQLGMLPHEAFKGPSKLESLEVILDTGVQ